MVVEDTDYYFSRKFKYIDIILKDDIIVITKEVLLMKKYVANRRDVCAGELLKPIGVSVEAHDANGRVINVDEMKELNIPVPTVSAGLVCRGMLFNVNEDGLANDLIYTTPTSYPIEGIQAKNNFESNFIITKYVELEELLKYLKYGIDLTQDDLNKIYRTLICSDRWLKHNMELFGWIKGSIGYSSGGIETIPMSIYDNLSHISCANRGFPYREEPEYKKIKRKR